MKRLLIPAILLTPLLAGATTATFSVDRQALRLPTAVAIAAPHQNAGGFSRVTIYFYAFPLTADQIAAVSTTGQIDVPEKRRRQRQPGDPDMNHSRAALHLLLARDGTLWNASLEVPGLTCTIVADPAAAASAIQSYENDGARVRVRAKGASVCDLSSVGGGQHELAWNVEVDAPLYRQR